MTLPHNPDELREILEFATTIAHEAGAVTLRYFGSIVAHEAKVDGSPVTAADREAEELLRRRVRERFPTHDILGEEMGGSADGGPVRWILDPIDATRSFMRGVPLYGVLIGIEVEGEPVVGVAHFPALQETVAAGRGLGCTWNGAPSGVSRIARVEDALVLTTDPVTILEGPDGPGWSVLVRGSSVRPVSASLCSWCDPSSPPPSACGRVPARPRRPARQPASAARGARIPDAAGSPRPRCPPRRDRRW